MGSRFFSVVVAVAAASLLLGCAPAEDASGGPGDPFTDDGKADDGTERAYRIVPETGAIDLEPNCELLGERLWYQPYTVDQDGNDFHVYRPEGAWYEMRRYLVVLDGPGLFEVTTAGEAPLLVDIWHVHPDGNSSVADGRNSASVEVLEAGRYGVIVSPSAFPVRTTEEEAYIDYDLTTAFGLVD